MDLVLAVGRGDMGEYKCGVGNGYEDVEGNIEKYGNRVEVRGMGKSDTNVL